MSKQERIQKGIDKDKEGVIGSETIGEKIRRNTPWIFGRMLRKPKIIFPKIRRKSISIPTPGKTFGVMIVYILLFILQTGVVYLIYRKPPAVGADSAGDPMFIYPNLHESFIVEGIVASILIFASSTGFILIYQASKHSFNRKMALRILVIGIGMIIGTFFALQYMLSVKMGTANQ
ncbi:MAG TPA: hypothetical protein VGB37_06070 [Candidatus Lokiarchaeia archaeon]